MFSIFRRNKALPAQSPSPNGFIQPASSQALLASPRRQKLLENIWQRASLSRSQFVELYRRPLERYAELVQQLPASQTTIMHTLAACWITGLKSSPMP